MSQRKAVRLKASGEHARRASVALRDELEQSATTQAQVNEVAAEMRATEAAVDRLRKERERQGLSLADVQRLTGMTRAAISRLENHHNRNPTVDTLSRYASALGMRLDLRVVRSR